MMVGTLKAGDHVDMVGTYTVHPPTAAPTTIVSRIIVRNVPVLQVSGLAQRLEGRRAAASTNPYIIVAGARHGRSDDQLHPASEGGGENSGADGLLAGRAAARTARRTA